MSRMKDVDKKVNKIWRSFKQKLKKLALGLTGKSFVICDIDIRENELGYTMSGKKIYLAPYNEIYKDMSFEERMIFIKGVFAHELMHQLNTDFAAEKLALERYTEPEKQIFHTIFNVIEDPAIEYWSKEYFVGSLANALKYTISTLYKNAPELSKEAPPFSQFISAILHYGDGGLIKGEFGSEEAKETFIKALPIMDKTILEPNGAKRVEYARELFELSKPLWHEDIKNAAEFAKQIKELLEQLVKRGMPMEGLNKNSDGPQGDAIEIEVSFGEGGEENGESSKEFNKEDAKSKARKATRDKLEKSEKKKCGKKSSKNNKSYSKEKNSTSDDDDFANDIDRIGGNPREYDKEAKECPDETIIDEIEYELTEDDIKSIQDEINSMEEEAELEEHEGEVDLSDLDIPSVSKMYNNAHVLNKIYSGDGNAFENEYIEIIERNIGGVNGLTKQLKRIFINDREERAYKQSGRLSVKRLQGSRMTSRVFAKRSMPKNKEDIAVMILVDISGSMHSKNKIRIAREAVVCLSEVFANLNIPTKVMTFAADREGYDVVHNHYINWTKSKCERIKLMTIQANGNNFDGFSIRYAAESIKKCSAEHKLLIVISDGQPACRYYKRHTDGIADTANAIREARKNTTTIGVAIDTDVEVLHSMYGAGFIYIKKTNELFEQLGNKIKKEIQSW